MKYFVATILIVVAIWLSQHNQFDKPKSLGREAVNINNRGYSENNDSIVPTKSGNLKKRSANRAVVARARTLFEAKQAEKALELLTQLSVEFHSDVEILNLRACCLVDLRRFDEAMEDFDTASRIEPTNPTLAFNAVEMRFVTQNWEEFLEGAENFSKNFPEVGSPYSDLVRLKQLLANFSSKRDVEAEALVEEYRDVADTPLGHFVRAVTAAREGDQLGFETELMSARRDFNELDSLVLFHDTLIEYGLLNRRQ